MAGSKKSVEETWIEDSRSFFKDVLKDTLANFLDDEISQSERLQLHSLKELWLQKYDTQKHQPDSNPVPLPKRKQPPRKRKRKQVTTAPLKETLPKEQSVDPKTLDDNVDIVYRIKIPKLRPHWPVRSIDLQIKAYVCKKNLIESLINWDLLDSIMELPLKQATALLQSHVDKMLQSGDI